MITRITAENRDKYNELFALANETISHIGPGVVDIEFADIVNLNLYFSYLKYLYEYEDDENLKSKFLRLPLDEDLFKINANTRNISIPSSFARNGVGVQGDESSEILYFSIDRYFDHQDLANEDVNIIIEWEVRDKDRQKISGISPAFGKDIRSIPGSIIFGWPIYSEFTQSAGTIKFAIRFFRLSSEPDANGKRSVIYSLATLPAEVSIGATFDYDLINRTVSEVDKGAMILNRINNARIYNPGWPIPNDPIFTSDLRVNGQSEKVVDLSGTTTPLELQISAVPNGDVSSISYDWQYYLYDGTVESGDKYATLGGLPELPENATPVHPGKTGIAYEEITIQNLDAREDPEDKDIYYRLDGTTGIYQPVDLSTYLDAEDHEYYEDLGYKTADGGGYVRLYRKYSYANVTRPGIYTVTIRATNGQNDSNDISLGKTNGIKIPGPETPNVTPAELQHVILTPEDNGTKALTVFAQAPELIASAQEDYQYGQNPDVTLSYAWKKKVNDETVDVQSNNNYALSNENRTLTVSGLTDDVIDETFFAEVTATRNTVEAKASSGQYRITEAPKIPNIKMRYLSGGTVQFKERNYTTDFIEYKDPTRDRSLSFSIDPIAHSDAVKCQWMKVNVEDNLATDWEKDLEDNDIEKLQIDLDGYLENIFDNPEGTGDTPVSDLITVDKARIQQITTAQDNMPAFEIDANTEDGIYYCLVLNELNGTVAANATPFFIVR